MTTAWISSALFFARSARTLSNIFLISTVFDKIKALSLSGVGVLKTESVTKATLSACQSHFLKCRTLDGITGMASSFFFSLNQLTVDFVH